MKISPNDARSLLDRLARRDADDPPARRQPAQGCGPDALRAGEVLLLVEHDVIRRARGQPHEHDARLGNRRVITLERTCLRELRRRGRQHIRRCAEQRPVDRVARIVAARRRARTPLPDHSVVLAIDHAHVRGHERGIERLTTYGCRRSDGDAGDRHHLGLGFVGERMRFHVGERQLALAARRRAGRRSTAHREPGAAQQGGQRRHADQLLLCIRAVGCAYAGRHGDPQQDGDRPLRGRRLRGRPRRRRILRRDLELAQPCAQLVAIDLHADCQLAPIVDGLVFRDSVPDDPHPSARDELAIELALARGPHVTGDEVAERARDRVRECGVERHPKRSPN
jgi:hypothetical protein